MALVTKPKAKTIPGPNEFIDDDLKHELVEQITDYIFKQLVSDQVELPRREGAADSKTNISAEDLQSLADRSGPPPLLPDTKDPKDSSGSASGAGDVYVIDMH